MDCNVGDDPGCDDCKVTPSVPLPEDVAGNWPLSPTPDAIGLVVNDAGAAPMLND
jgi:hypothetical protein